MAWPTQVGEGGQQSVEKGQGVEPGTGAEHPDLMLGPQEPGLGQLQTGAGKGLP